MKPTFILSRHHMTVNGFLSTRSLALISSKMLRQGVVLFPGDYSYCVGTYAHSWAVRDIIAHIAGTNEKYIPIAFSSYHSSQGWFIASREADAISEAFTPGPLVMYCTPNDRAKSNSFFSKHDIGVKVSGSPVERDIANSSSNYLLASATLKGDDGLPVYDFSKACEIVEARTDNARGGVGWAAVEGREFQLGAATSIILSQGNVEILEEGSISAAALVKAVKQAPLSDYADWG